MASIKVVSAIAVLFNGCMIITFGAGLYNYSQDALELDLVVQVGSLAAIVASIAKMMSAMQAYSWAKDRTDRTPENKLSMTQFTWIVTIFSTFVTLVVVNLVEKHCTESKAYASIKELDIKTTVDGIEVSVSDQLDGYVEDTKTIFLCLTSFQLLTHYLLHRLNSKENNIPRIVDLKAARAKLE